MKNNHPRNLGFILVGVGLFLIAFGLYGLLRPAEFQSQARITLETLNGSTKAGRTLDDPYWREIEIETIQSDVVLSNVVSRLDLGSVWGNKHYNDQKLSIAETIALLRRHVDVRLVSNTALVDICATSEDPAEAALIANAVAEAYRDWRNGRGRRMMEAGIAELAKQREKVNQQIKNSEDELERLRQELNIPSPEPGIGFSRTNFPVYAEAEKNLAELKDFERLLARKFKIEQGDLLFPYYPQQRIIESAVPALTPDSQQRWLGRTFLIVGLACFGLGITLVLNSRFKSS